MVLTRKRIKDAGDKCLGVEELYGVLQACGNIYQCFFVFFTLEFLILLMRGMYELIKIFSARRTLVMQQSDIRGLFKKYVEF